MIVPGTIWPVAELFVTEFTNWSYSERQIASFGLPVMANFPTLSRLLNPNPVNAGDPLICNCLVTVLSTGNHSARSMWHALGAGFQPLVPT